MKFCTQCGKSLDHVIPPDDNRPRHVCTSCGHIHYLNPKIVAGCLPVFEDRVLLCQRAIEPRLGLWTLPAGFMENGETIAEGALREMHEEANAVGVEPSLYTVFSLPHISQVYMFFRTTLSPPTFSAGSESLDVKLFTEDEIPWDELAFPVITRTLEHFFADRTSREFPLHTEDIRFKR